MEGREGEAGLDGGEDFGSGDKFVAVPGVGFVEGHVFDVADGDVEIEGEVCEGEDLRVVEPADDDGVEFEV